MLTNNDYIVSRVVSRCLYSNKNKNKNKIQHHEKLTTPKNANGDEEIRPSTPLNPR